MNYSPIDVEAHRGRGRLAVLRPGKFLLMACLVLWAVLLVKWATLPNERAYAQGGTTVAGTITSDTTWTEANDPYHIDGYVVVENNVTLTIEAGVEVNFAENLSLRVEGTLLAHGTAAQPIHFTAVNPTPNFWQGIEFFGEENNPARAELTHVVIEYGGGGSTQSANVTIHQAHVSIRDSIIRYGGQHGIYSSLGSKVDLYNTNFVENNGYAAKFEYLVDDPKLVALSASGNVVDGVGISNLSDDPQVLLEESGLPYIVDTILQVNDNQELTIHPNVELRFAPDARLDVFGTLIANGMAEQMIRFTGVEPTPGSWLGIAFAGQVSDPAIGELAHVVIEYGGSGSTQSANVTIHQAHVSIRDSIIRHGGQHGVYVGQGAQKSTIAASQIVDNTADGIHNGYPEQSVQAPDNWWGTSAGPQAPFECNPGGTGESVSAGVLFIPFRTSASVVTQSVPTVFARLVSISPRRWYAPVGFPLYVDITVTDGNGYPVVGEPVRLSKSNIGGGGVEIVDGNVTDAMGHTFALLTGQVAGDIALVGRLDETSCQDVRSAETLITITGAEEAGLLPDAQAPYLNNGLEIDPLPIVRGVTTTLRATLINPNDFPVTVAGQFSFAQSGIGLVFGPLDEFNDIQIPAHGQVVVEVEWQPSVAGHYCIRLDYTFTGAAMATVAQTRRAQRNLDVRPGPFLNTAGKNAAQKAKNSTDALSDGQYPLAILTGPANIINMLIGDQMTGNITDFIYEGGGGINCSLGGGESCSGWNGPRLKLPGDTIGNLQKDPPRQDYQEIAPIDPITFTRLIPGTNLSQARADALNELVAASLELAPHLIATVVTFDRYAGATEAKRLEWASIQANYYGYYLFLSSNSMIRVGRAYAKLHQVLVDEGVHDLYIRSDDYRAYQERLRSEGFNAIEVEAAHRVGLSDEDLEAIRQRRIALDPEEEAGSILTHLLEMANLFTTAGNLMIGPPAFGVSASPGIASSSDQAPTHNLVIVNAQTFEIQVGNPTAAPGTLDLRIRPVDIPPDWTVVVSPTQVALNAGENITAQVTVYPGLATVQDKHHTVAVEGFIANQLIGGVALQVVAPHWVDLNDLWPLFLPHLERH